MCFIPTAREISLYSVQKQSEDNKPFRYLDTIMLWVEVSQDQSSTTAIRKYFKVKSIPASERNRIVQPPGSVSVFILKTGQILASAFTAFKFCVRSATRGEGRWQRLWAGAVPSVEQNHVCVKSVQLLLCSLEFWMLPPPVPQGLFLFTKY